MSESCFRARLNVRSWDVVIGVVYHYARLIGVPCMVAEVVGSVHIIARLDGY